jgi:hypothetical protein
MPSRRQGLNATERGVEAIAANAELWSGTLSAASFSSSSAVIFRGRFAEPAIVAKEETSSAHAGPDPVAHPRDAGRMLLTCVSSLC